MIRRPPRSTLSSSSAASDVYKRQLYNYDQKVGPTLVNGGGGGVPELNELLEEGAIQYGLIRMSFGTGRFRRTKYIFFQWAGDAVSAMKKGRAAMDVPAMVDKLGRALSLIHISEPTRLLSISYAVFCLKKKNLNKTIKIFDIY
eukprot:TRINITY_DN56516_c0_g1_i1.p1 TRINITY_DN56516_c0_g1~~TRINITY_DN56516_c0_g1_i1.p1  ORF type:complete len:144 (-),score=25.43 TRINITY_DN56516_c0_g1_i1:79-510(-)